MIATAVWIGTWQLGESVRPERFEEDPAFTTVALIMGFDLAMAWILAGGSL